MRVTMMLCDYAVVAEGKLYVSGAGWTLAGGPPVQSALGLIIEVPWDKLNLPVRFAVELQDADGGVVLQPGPMEQGVPMRFEGEFELGRPPGMPHGTPSNVPLALNVPPFGVPAGRYRWVTTLNGEGHEDWHVSFDNPNGTQEQPPTLASDVDSD